MNNKYVNTPLTITEAKRVVVALSEFLENSPVIPDVALLPHSKATCIEALQVLEKHLCDLANDHMDKYGTRPPAEIDTSLNTVRTNRAVLDGYQEIDPTDRVIVTQFNSRYKSMKDIPNDLRDEHMRLYVKYYASNHGLFNDTGGKPPL